MIGSQANIRGYECPSVFDWSVLCFRCDRVWLQIWREHVRCYHKGNLRLSTGDLLDLYSCSYTVWYKCCLTESKGVTCVGKWWGYMGSGEKTVSTFAIQWGYYRRPVEIYKRSCIATLHVRLNYLVVPTLHISISSQEFMSQVQQIMTHSEHKV